MVRSLAIIVSTMALATVIWTGFAASLTEYSQSAAWVRGLYERKEKAARRFAGPKLVLVGGSGAHYSFSASYLTELTGLPAVNFGTAAGLGPRYILFRARRALRAGDVALLAIETPINNAVVPSELTAEQVVSSDPAYLLHESPERSFRILFGLTPRYCAAEGGEHSTSVETTSDPPRRKRYRNGRRRVGGLQASDLGRPHAAEKQIAV